jgi:hypothetical protein
LEVKWILTGSNRALHEIQMSQRNSSIPSTNHALQVAGFCRHLQSANPSSGGWMGVPTTGKIFGNTSGEATGVEGRKVTPTDPIGVSASVFSRYQLSKRGGN